MSKPIDRDDRTRTATLPQDDPNGRFLQDRSQEMPGEAVATSQLLAPGARVGRYRVDARLGSGGMGAVYRAHDLTLERDVALKVLFSGSKHVATFRRALREARAVAAFDHPNAVRVLDVGEIDGTPFLAMELVEGTSLRAYIGKEEPPLAQRVQWLVAIAEALDAAHRQGIVHRDVKPDNVMIREDGIVKVVDFGIAHIADEAKRTITISRKGIAIGTPAYMAPEQLRGERVDPRTDQFSWGVLAYELIDGNRPWNSSDPVRLVGEILNAELPTSSRIPGEMAQVLSRSVSKEAGARYASMSDLILALEETLGAPRPDAPNVQWKDYRLGAAGLSLLILAGLHVVRREAPVVTNSERGRLEQGSAISQVGPEARSRFDAATRDFWEGSIQEAEIGFERATVASPEYGLAHLWAAILSHEPDNSMREHLHRAGQLRGQMDAPQLELFRCVEPWRNEPPDWARSVSCLDALIARTPADVVPRFVQGWVLLRKGDSQRALAVAEEAVWLDARFGAAQDLRAEAAVSTANDETFERSLRECLANAPASSNCVRLSIYELDWKGRCADAVERVTKLIRAAPETPLWYMELANDQFAATGDLDQARRILSERAALTPMPRRRIIEFRRDVNLALLEGDFDLAEQLATSWQAEVSQSPEEMEHLRPLRIRAYLALETEHPNRAVGIAQDYLRRQTAWTTDDFETGTRIHAFIAEYLAGAISRDKFREEQDAWLEQERARARKNGRNEHSPYLWLIGYAPAVKDRADADYALQQLADYQPMFSPMDRGVALEWWIGRMYRLSGRIVEARQSLEWAARSCEAINFPFEQTWAFEMLANVLEEAGDANGACINYARVISRWGRIPKSVTAREARAGWSRLNCEYRQSHQ